MPSLQHPLATKDVLLADGATGTISLTPGSTQVSSGPLNLERPDAIVGLKAQ